MKKLLGELNKISLSELENVIINVKAECFNNDDYVNASKCDNVSDDLDNLLPYIYNNKLNGLSVGDFIDNLNDIKIINKIKYIINGLCNIMYNLKLNSVELI